MRQTHSPKPATQRPAQQVRIIAGRWRGRKLAVADVAGLRPSGDRIRETVFNWLAPSLVGAQVLDLFAGSGALGFEALSRGAASATLIEQHPQAARQLRQSAQLLEAQCTIVQGDALQWLQGYHGPGFDVVFLDPPFAANLWQSSIELLFANACLKPTGQLYVEYQQNAPSPPPGWHYRRQQRAGQVGYGLICPLA